MKRISSVLLVLYCCLTFAWSQTSPTQVVVISSLHKVHQSNPNYSYEDLYQFIQNFNADVIGIEVRPEEMDSGVNVIKEMYPLEMATIKEQFGNKIMYGFDWWGKDFEGKLITREVWNTESKIRKLQVQLSQDTDITNRLKVLSPVKKAMEQLATTGSISHVNDGTYDLLSTIYYEQMGILLNATLYADLVTFYKDRDNKIAENIINIIKAHPGKKLVFVLGADHRSHTVTAITNALDEKIQLYQFK